MPKIKGQPAPGADDEDDLPEDEELELEVAEAEPDPLLTRDEPAAEEDEDDLPDLKPTPVQQAAATDPRLVAALQALAEGQSHTAAQVAQLNSDRLDIAEHQVDGQINALVAQRGEALTNGDMAAFNQLDAQLADARLKKDQVDQLRRSMKAAPAKAPKVDIPAADAPPSAPNYSTQARTWMSRNTWFNPQGGDEASDIAGTISNQLLARGITANDPRHYEEVDKRMAKLFPQHYKAAGGQRRPAAASGARQSTQESAAPKNKVTISPRTMRNFELAGFDINDPKVRQQMAKAVRETQTNHNVRQGSR